MLNVESRQLIILIPNQILFNNKYDSVYWHTMVVLENSRCMMTLFLFNFSDLIKKNYALLDAITGCYDPGDRYLFISVSHIFLYYVFSLQYTLILKSKRCLSLKKLWILFLPSILIKLHTLHSSKNVSILYIHRTKLYMYTFV